MLRYLFPARLRQWLGPLLVAGIAAAVLGILVVVSGFVDLSARKPHPDGWARFLHYSFRRSTAFHEGPKPPADLDSPVRVAAGAAYYSQVCAHCHGAPGLGQNPVVLSMHPRPQFLATDLRQPDAGYSSRELFRIVHAGVKYSAMPGWPAEGRDDEVWQLVAFLRALPRMTPDAFRTAANFAPPAAPPPTAHAMEPHPVERAYAMINNREPPVASYSYRWPVYPFGADPVTAIDPAVTCAQCHGADGAGRGAFPNLTIQDRGYLRRTLTAFAGGQRRSGFMRVVASRLSPGQIQALSVYYAELPRKATQTGGTTDPSGQRLALVGDPARGLGPCAGCHGVTGAAAKAYPLLEGQSAWYIANQMRVFRVGGRGGIEGENPMSAIAKKLDDREVAALARYYAAQPPAARQSFAAVTGR